jgi:hypothetical protein
MAKKKAVAKKEAPAGMEVHINLGSLKATPEQTARLKAYVSNQVVTWVKADLKNKTAPPLACFEEPIPPV